MNRSTSSAALAVIILSFLLSVPAAAQEFSAASLADYGNVTVMEVSGGYDAKNPDGSVNSGPRKAIASEFFRTHKDEYDFIVVFSNFYFPMPDDGHAKAFYLGVKNDTLNIGINAFNYAQEFGSTNDRLQGMVDMGNLGGLVTDPMDPKFNETLYILSHEMMHRWGAQAKFNNSDGSISTALLGKDQDHWSFLLDSGGSLLYGNRWQDNGNGTFTSLAPQNEMKLYSPLDLYLMGMIDKFKVPPMLLIESPGIDPGRMPEAGVTITGIARTVTIDDIIAAMGTREPDASTSQKSFKTAFIYITRPGTFTPDAIYQIENIRNGFVTRHSILTDGRSIVEVVPSTRDDFPVNPGILPPSITPRTSPASISEGVQWLKTNQKSDGSWADLPETEERDTAEAVLVLRNFLDAQANYGYGLQRLGLSTSGNTDFLCRKIEACAAAKQDTADLLAELLARRNSDGGWGSDRMYQSNPADTGLALKALALAGYGDQNVIASAISYLTVRQNSDGGWGPDDNSSTLQFTAAVLSAFYKYRGSYPLEDRINRGMALVASRQNTDMDKGFGNSPSTVYDTATAVLVLRELGASTDITNNGLDYIRGRQGGDGSWDSSAFQTAMAIDAVYKATVDPDLSVKTADISFIPATITSLPANIVINANIWNLGQTAVSQAVVALYKDSITEANRIAEQAVSFPGQQATTVAFPAVVTDGNEHRFFIVVDPANLVKESIKANNSSAAIIAAESTYDFEVLPKDITLSANTVDLFQDVTITAKITNKGTMNAYNAQVKYFIDDPMNPFAIATSTIDIPAGATVIDNIIWRANRSGLNMSLTVLADPLNTFAELSETNNRASTTITVNSDTRPNITVSYKDMVIIPIPAMQGGSATISALVKNEGASPAGPVTVNFFRGVPDQNALILGTRTIPLLAPGESSGASVGWVNIPESGEKIIFIQAFLENAAAEVRTDDNNAFITLNILSLPDLAISTNSITFSPAFPKENDTVTIIATIRNEGEQSVQDVVVNAFEGSTLIGTQTIAMIPGLMATSATFTYNTTGKQGTHEITVIIDPENIVTEQNRSNNRASRSFGVQNANLWVTEQYLSPNGDGVKESTQLLFRLETPRTVTVKVINQAGETVRTFSGTGLQNVDSASVEWNGLNDGGMLVDDGSYLIELREAAVVIGSVSVIVDTNRSPFLDAIGTKYLLNNNLTCMLPDSRQWKWFPDDSGILLDISYTDSNVPDFPSGLYGISTDGQDILQLVTEENAGFNYAFGYEHSHDGEKIAYIRGKTDNYRAFPEYVQLVVMDRDGTHVNPVVSFDNTSGASNVDIYDAFWSSRDNSLLYRTYSYATMLELRLLRSDGATLGLDTGGVTYSDFIRWSPDGSRIAYVFGSIDENDNYREVIRVVDLAGNKRDVAVPDDYATIFYIQYFEWLNADKVILQDRNIIKLLDMSGSGAHASIIPNEHVDQIFPSPAGTLFAFVSGGYDASLLSIADASGNVVQREARTGTGNCVPTLSGITWSQDGEKLAFSDRLVTCGDCWPACIDPYGPHVIVQDAKTRKETSFSHAMEPLK
jgi:subtilase family serine protease